MGNICATKPIWCVHIEGNSILGRTLPLLDTRITDNPWHFMFLEMLIRNVTAISVLGDLVVMTLTQIVRNQGLVTCLGTEFFRSCHLFNPLLHLVANMISELEIHEDMLSPWRGECDYEQHPEWSNGYDAHPDNKRPGFNASFRHRIYSDYVTYSAHCQKQRIELLTDQQSTVHFGQ